MHYSECVLWSGPLVHFYCMRFEGKHNELAKRAQAVNNFKNIPKTIIRVSQCIQCEKWSSGNVKINHHEVVTGKTKFVCSTLSRQYLLRLGFEGNNSVCVTKSVLVNSVEFRPKLFVILEKASSRNDSLHLVGRIEEIIVTEEKNTFFQIIAEFELMSPEKCDDFLSKFGPYYVPRIFEYTRICNYDLWKKHNAITDDVLKALLLLITLLPVSNAVKNKSKKKVDKPMDSSQKKKVKMIEPYRFMIENINAGANVQEFVKSKRSECTSTIQPYIIQVDGETPHFYVIADNAILTCNNRNDFTVAFDLMFKIYFIFNIQYPVSLQNVYTFIESYVYRLIEKKSISIVASLYVNLKNMNLTHDSNSSDSDE
ncbi:uncharacterized protein LOC116416561 [Nasonia vitripennis]|uniref:Uncharacterized protein n=1 Tax=Nasonia vitripennis TaxID=7425 RepID=A0A7M7Q440_NASVI|nr:uncharacterized protein LOC116416561 [Nasonia vitripennis]